MKIRPTVFIIMPITPRNPEKNPAMEYLENCREGIRLAVQLIKEGFAPICPALDFSYWLSVTEGPTADEIYESDLSVLRKMDAVYTLGDWSSSPNCRRELHTAWAYNIPCFSDIKTFIHWKDQVFYGREK